MPFGVDDVIQLISGGGGAGGGGDTWGGGGLADHFASRWPNQQPVEGGPPADVAPGPGHDPAGETLPVQEFAAAVREGRVEEWLASRPDIGPDELVQLYGLLLQPDGLGGGDRFAGTPFEGRPDPRAGLGSMGKPPSEEQIAAAKVAVRNVGKMQGVFITDREYPSPTALYQVITRQMREEAEREGRGRTLPEGYPSAGQFIQMQRELAASPGAIPEGTAIYLNPQGRTYRARPGETLRTIAERNGVSPEALASANGDLPLDTDVSGSEVLIPYERPQTPSPAMETQTPLTPTQDRALPSGPPGATTTETASPGGPLSDTAPESEDLNLLYADLNPAQLLNTFLPDDTGAYARRLAQERAAPYDLYAELINAASGRDLMDNDARNSYYQQWAGGGPSTDFLLENLRSLSDGGPGTETSESFLSQGPSGVVPILLSILRQRMGPHLASRMLSQSVLNDIISRFTEQQAGGGGDNFIAYLQEAGVL